MIWKRYRGAVLGKKENWNRPVHKVSGRREAFGTGD